MPLDWSQYRPSNKPTKKQVALYHEWIKYLKDSKLSTREIYSRAEKFAERGLRPRDE